MGEGKGGGGKGWGGKGGGERSPVKPVNRYPTERRGGHLCRHGCIPDVDLFHVKH